MGMENIPIIAGHCVKQNGLQHVIYTKIIDPQGVNRIFFSLNTKKIIFNQDFKTKIYTELTQKNTQELGQREFTDYNRFTAIGYCGAQQSL